MQLVGARIKRKTDALGRFRIRRIASGRSWTVKISHMAFATRLCRLAPLRSGENRRFLFKLNDRRQAVGFPDLLLGAIDGRVINEATARGIPRATVRIAGSSRETVTNRTGRFSFERLTKPPLSSATIFYISE